MCNQFAKLGLLSLVFAAIAAMAPAHAQTTESVAFAAGGACVGSCTPETCPSGTATQQDNCGCKGGATSCKCKGKNKCYNANGALIATVSCTGSCRWDKNAAYIPDELDEIIDIEVERFFTEMR